MALDELACEGAIGGCSRASGSVFQDRFAEARRFAQTNAARDDSFINALPEMLAHLRHHLLTKICPTVEHRHDNAAAPESRTCSTSRTIFTRPSSAKYSHCIGVKSSSAAASALHIRIPSEGGQSNRTKSKVSSVCNGLSVSAKRVRWSGIRAISTSA